MSHYEIVETQVEGQELHNSDQGGAKVAIAQFSSWSQGFQIS